MRTELTEKQKLQALAMRYYDGVQWEPKKGDFYTTSRADLQLYQIVDEDENNFYTDFCHPTIKTNGPAQWSKDTFLQDFGERRVYVHESVFNV
jgi:hypothetical protein